MAGSGPSQAGCHSTHGRATTSAALRPIRQGSAATLSERGASARPEFGGGAEGGHVCADPRFDLRGVYVAASARMRERVHPAVGAWDGAGGRVRRASRPRGKSWTVDAATPGGIAAPGSHWRRTGPGGGLLDPASGAHALAPHFGSGRKPPGSARRCTGLALQCGPCDDDGAVLWIVTGLVVFAPT